MSEAVQINESYIGGDWLTPLENHVLDIVDPATETPVGELSLAGIDDVAKAVHAAQLSQAGFGQTTREERIDILSRILHLYLESSEDLAWDTCRDIGAPIEFSRRLQVASGASNLRSSIDALKSYSFVEKIGNSEVERGPTGVCGLITPWNWPLNQITAKVGAAIAAGCSIVLKPSELAPRTAYRFAQILDAAGLENGTFNMIVGDARAGAALAKHAGISAISFTGSTAVGIDVAMTAAPNVTRVSQELGGKSPYIVVDGDCLPKAVADCTRRCIANSGQSCNAPTRLLVPANRIAEAEAVAGQTVEAIKIGDPRDSQTQLGPVVSRRQFERIQESISEGIDSGAKVVSGGLGRPAGAERGFFVRPTVFSEVDNASGLAQEEIFGPVLAVIPYKSTDEAIELANASRYGLSAYVAHDQADVARDIASRLRAGMVHINFAGTDPAAPFGGYGHSGNGRERGVFGMEEFLEVKSIFGHRSV